VAPGAAQGAAPPALAPPGADQDVPAIYRCTKTWCFRRRLRLAWPPPARIQSVLAQFDPGEHAHVTSAAANYVMEVVAAYNAQWLARYGAAPVALPLDTRAWYNLNLETRWNLMPGPDCRPQHAPDPVDGDADGTAGNHARQGTAANYHRAGAIEPDPAGGPVLVPDPNGRLGPALYAALSLFTVAWVDIGLSISTLSSRMQQAMLYTFVLIMPLMLMPSLGCNGSAWKAWDCPTSP